MPRRYDPRVLLQLKQLCAVKQRMARYATLEADMAVEMSVAQRTARETAVIDSETAWRDHLAQPDLGPIVAAWAALELVRNADELRDASHQETRAQQELVFCQSEQSLCEARHRQAKTLYDAADRIARRRDDERRLGTVEDRTAYRWSKR